MIPQHKDRNGRLIETPREHYARQERRERREALVDLALALLFITGTVGVLVWLA